MGRPRVHSCVARSSHSSRDAHPCGATVPFLIWYRGIEPDDVQQYDEVSCVDGSFGLLKLDGFMKALMAEDNVTV